MQAIGGHIIKRLLRDLVNSIGIRSRLLSAAPLEYENRAILLT